MRSTVRESIAGVNLLRHDGAVIWIPGSELIDVGPGGPSSSTLRIYSQRWGS